MSRKKPKTETRYEISVWNIVEGDVVKKLWEATDAELADIKERYGDEPFYDIVIDREWEEVSDD
jgi:hypothetical protein